MGGGGFLGSALLYLDICIIDSLSFVWLWIRFLIGSILCTTCTSWLLQVILFFPLQHIKERVQFLSCGEIYNTADLYVKWAVLEFRLIQRSFLFHERFFFVCV